MSNCGEWRVIENPDLTYPDVEQRRRFDKDETIFLTNGRQINSYSNNNNKENSYSNNGNNGNGYHNSNDIQTNYMTNYNPYQTLTNNRY